MCHRTSGSLDCENESEGMKISLPDHSLYTYC